MANRIADLPSGAKLEVQLAPFADSKALYQAFAMEATKLKVDATVELDVNLFKDIAAVALSSREIEKAMWVCMKRCLYKGAPITPETFEPVEAREDYLPACMEVAQENVAPFMKSLISQWKAQAGGIQSYLASLSVTKIASSTSDSSMRDMPGA